ncbi:dockerin type I repeat-containing protein [Geomesophilobacter sediminis]|uniref:Dockerin type I repeat-containing protein n=1 Tax=Geomesophilobacter sediminis TaxID=2798584 RepID=A0A8J7JKX2_9BACT|nr:dockerin type I repeat-containing protein [Geomesophilobacter sediminis]MBJ6724265.1 dockerin type I repeat-containing protein [Geomesophilobacter sediminis]
MRKMIVILLIMLMPGGALGTTYYVSTSGDDGNDGISPATPWKSLFKLNRTLFLPGDTILFKRGDVWSGADMAPIIPASSGTAGNPITWGAYGSGPNPVLTAASYRSKASDWKNEGGNIWSTGGITLGPEMLLNPDLATNADGWYDQCTGGGAACGFLGRITSEAPPGFIASYEFVVYDHGAATGNVQLYTSSGYPLSFEQGSYYAISFLAKSSVPFQIPDLILQAGGVDITSGMYVKSLRVGADWTPCTLIFRADRTGVAGLNILLGGPTGAPNGAILHLASFSCRQIADRDFFGMYHSANLIFDFSSGNPSTGTLVQSGNLSHQGDWYQSYGDRRIRIYSTSNPADYYQNDILIVIGMPKTGFWINAKNYHTVQNLDFFAMPSAWYGANFTGNTVEHCNAYYTGGDLQVDPYDYRWGSGAVIVRKGESVGATGNISNWTVRYNDFRQTYDCNVTWQNSDAGAKADGIWVYYNILGLAHYNIEFGWNGTGSLMSNLHIYNNVMYDAGKEWSANQRPDEPVETEDAQIKCWNSPGNGANFYINNNIMVGGVSQMLYFGDWSQWSSILTMDDNVYFERPSTFAKVGGISYASFSEWQGSSRRDAVSLYADPLFVSRSRDDFHLMPSSPAIGAGVPVGLTVDFDGGAIDPSAPSIGAFEFSNIVHYSVADSVATYGILPTAPITLDGLNASDQVSAHVSAFDGSNQLVALDANLPVGVYTLKVTGLDGAQATLYRLGARGNHDGTLTIKPASQTITFPVLPMKSVGDPPFLLDATATSGLPVSYASSDPKVATVAGSTVTIVGPGTTTITTTQSGDANHTAAASVDRILTVAPQSPGVLGDLNGDGVVDIADALVALKIAIGAVSPTSMQVALGDVAPLVDGKPSPDGTINAGDVVLILEKIVGLKNW